MLNHRHCHLPGPAKICAGDSSDVRLVTNPKEIRIKLCEPMSRPRHAECRMTTLSVLFHAYTFLSEEERKKNGFFFDLEGKDQNTPESRTFLLRDDPNSPTQYLHTVLFVLSAKGGIFIAFEALCVAWLLGG
jgi:hypothetical protein